MVALVLGSGLKNLVNHLSVKRSMSYSEFLDFKIKTLEGHDRILYEASLGDKTFLILSGKLHLYEGLSYEQCIAPLRSVAEKYDVTNWIITSASGAFNKNTVVGQWQKISSLLTLENISGLRSNKHFKASKNPNGKTYAFQKGPSLGTVAEYKMLSNFGADLVGMSLLPESIFLKSINAQYTLYSLPVCSYSALNYNITEPTHRQVIQIADQGVLDLLKILKEKVNSK